MPGPVSDSYDPEFGTSNNAREVRDAVKRLRAEITAAIGTEELRYILDVVQERSLSFRDLRLSERQLRIIRFCIDRTLETL